MITGANYFGRPITRTLWLALFILLLLALVLVLVTYLHFLTLAAAGMSNLKLGSNQFRKEGIARDRPSSYQGVSIETAAKVFKVGTANASRQSKLLVLGYSFSNPPGTTADCFGDQQGAKNSDGPLVV